MRIRLYSESSCSISTPETEENIWIGRTVHIGGQIPRGGSETAVRGAYEDVHISIDNFFQVFHISQQLQNSGLSEDVIQFFSEDASEIVASEKWVEFIQKHPEEVRVLLKGLEKAGRETKM